MIRLLVILSLFYAPLQKGASLKISLPAQQKSIFSNYSNENFSQKVVYKNNKVIIDLKGINYYNFGDNYWIKKDKEFIKKLDNRLIKAINYIYAESPTLDIFFSKMSIFIKDRIKYSEAELSQEPLSVITLSKANCIGYSNLVSLFLNAISIKNKFVKGFFLKTDNNEVCEPIPHRWIEIYLKNGVIFFFDPQYQNFSSHYIVVQEQTDFTQIRKFNIQIIKKIKFFKN